MRGPQLSKAHASESNGAESKDAELSASTGPSSAGNGAMLRTMDSNSRRNALPQEAETSAKSGSADSTTDSSETASSPSSTMNEGEVAANTSIATDSTGIVATNTAIANDSSGLEAAKAAMQNDLTQLASDPKAFHEAMEKIFGENYDQGKAETIRQQVMEGDFSWMPEIRVVDESVLQDQSGTQGPGQALGAYSKDNDTIYISKQLLESDPEKAAQILTEEVGHALDARLNTSDAAGDEGDIFARIVGGEEISDAELSALQAENDSGTIIVDGKEVEVEYGWLSKAFKAVTKPFKAIGSAISSGFKSLMQSKLFNTILMVAQFIPIPIVQVAVRVINIAKAAYQVVQGIKHGSIGMVLGGVAGVAGGVGNVGQMLGASAKFVDTATKIANGARTASAGYQALAQGNFQAAAGLASNFFGGADTQLGRNIGAAGQAIGAVESAKNGDILGAIQDGRAAYSGFTASNDASSDSVNNASGSSSAAAQSEPATGIQGFIDSVKGNATFQAVSENVSTIRDIVKDVKDGNISDAAQMFLGNYAEDLGISQNTQDTITEWAGVVETVNDTKEALEDGKYPAAIGNAAQLLGIPLSQNNQNRLETVFKIRDSVMGKQYANASRQAASLSLQSGETELAGNFLRLANLLDGKLLNPAQPSSVSSAA